MDPYKQADGWSKFKAAFLVYLRLNRQEPVYVARFVACIISLKPKQSRPNRKIQADYRFWEPLFGYGSKLSHQKKKREF